MNVQLESWRLENLDALVNLANNPKIAAFMMDSFPHPYTKTFAQKYIENACRQEVDHLFAIKANGELAGGIGIFVLSDIQCKNAEIGYWLGEPFWNKGIMTNAVQKMVRYAFEKYSVDRIFARPFHTNLASIQVLEKTGFEKEAEIKSSFYKSGKYYNELIYAIRREKSIL